MIFAIDPGSIRSGVALLTYNADTSRANLVLLQVQSKDQIMGTIKTIAKPGVTQHTVVLEDFKHAMATGNFRGKKSAEMAFHERETHKLAKMIKAAAMEGKHNLVIQEPSVLAMGRKWCDLPCPKKGHIPDEISAYIHGAHYLIKSGRINSVLDIDKYGQETMT